jgi:transposase
MRRPQETSQPEFWDGVLGLDELEVVHYEFDAERRVRRLTAVPRCGMAPCPDCGRMCDHVHQTRERGPIRDLPIGDRSVELRVRVFQFACESCDRKFTPALECLAEGAQATERFLAKLAELVRVSDIANAAAFFGIPEKTLEGWYYDYVERQQAARQEPPSPIRTIGIDELSQKKGGGGSSR